MMRNPLLLSALGTAWLLIHPAPASAEVRHCVTSSGQSVFTDRKCAELDATEQAPRAAAVAAGAPRATGCARTLDDLVFEMSRAIDARDANRLAAVYHWPGLSSDAGYRIWKRLDAIANRPLVDVVPLMPSTLLPHDADAGASTAAVSTQGNDAAMVRAHQADGDVVDGNLYPQTVARQNPIGLRVEQTLENGMTPSRTVFALARHFGCWWLRF